MTQPQQETYTLEETLDALMKRFEPVMVYCSRANELHEARGRWEQEKRIFAHDPTTANRVAELERRIAATMDRSGSTYDSAILDLNCYALGMNNGIDQNTDISELIKRYSDEWRERYTQEIEDDTIPPGNLDAFKKWNAVVTIDGVTDRQRLERLVYAFMEIRSPFNISPPQTHLLPLPIGSRRIPTPVNTTPNDDNTLRTFQDVVKQ